MDAVAAFLQHTPVAALAAWAAVACVCVVLAVLLLAAGLVAYESLKSAPKGGTPTTLPNGMRVMQWQSFETDFLYKEIFGDASAYARGGLLFGPGQTIVDCGANIGFFTLAAALRTQGRARILSFEPMPSTFAVLDANVRALLNGDFDAQLKLGGAPRALDVRAFNVGLSDAPANVTFEHHPRASIWSTSNAEFAHERQLRLARDVTTLMSTSPNMLVRALPSPFVYWMARGALASIAATVKVPAKLVTLSSVFDAEKVTSVDLLKVDVEGAEMSVLAGIKPRHWPMIQQVVLEVENFATVDAASALLRGHGFTVSSVATERESTPGVQSEVSMVYAVRPGYALPAAAAKAATAAAAKRPSLSPAAAKRASRSPAAKKRASPASKRG